MTAQSNSPAVFINCPSDRSYRTLFEAIVFGIMALGFRVRCALERDTGTEERLAKIMQIIGECQFGIHDLSFMGTDPGTRLPRHNMAFELGLFLGCCEFGGESQGGKGCLILDRKRWRYRKSLSDLSGRDIQAHEGDPKRAIVIVRNWLVSQSSLSDRPGGTFVFSQYEQFRKELPKLCLRAKRRVKELSFGDYCETVAAWLEVNA